MRRLGGNLRLKMNRLKEHCKFGQKSEKKTCKLLNCASRDGLYTINHLRRKFSKRAAEVVILRAHLCLSTECKYF